MNMALLLLLTHFFKLILIHDVCCKTDTNGKQQPNIIFILADDMGYNDIGYHNSDVISPSIDGLARNGITLEQNYVQPRCTPSRAALLTGMYSIFIVFSNL